MCLICVAISYYYIIFYPNGGGGGTYNIVSYALNTWFWCSVEMLPLTNASIKHKWNTSSKGYANIIGTKLSKSH